MARSHKKKKETSLNTESLDLFRSVIVSDETS
jgi:hypothetical protein